MQALKYQLDNEVNLKLNPTSRSCHNIIASKGTAILGVSPFNSYFSEENIFQLAKWASETFHDVYLFIPDVQSKYTLMAMGYDESKAIKKAKKQGNWYNNKAIKALIKLGLSEQEAASKILNGRVLSEVTLYNQKVIQYTKMFNTNSYFRGRCLEAANWVLQGKVDATEEALIVAAKYFISELPLFFNSNEIFNIESACFLYHSCPKFVMDTFTYDSLGILDNNQAFGVINQIEKGA